MEEHLLKKQTLRDGVINERNDCLGTVHTSTNWRCLAKKISLSNHSNIEIAGLLKKIKSNIIMT